MAQQEFADFDLELNLEGVDAWGGEYSLAPAGDFSLTLVNLEKKPSKNQQPMLVATFEIADEGEYKGRKVWNNYSLQPQALGRLKQLSVACGADLSHFYASQHVGQTIRATIIHTESAGGIDDQGNTRAPKTFANVINEMPLDEQPVVEEKPAKPPVMKAGGPKAPAAKPTANGAPRRA